MIRAFIRFLTPKPDAKAAAVAERDQARRERDAAKARRETQLQGYWDHRLTLATRKCLELRA